MKKITIVAMAVLALTACNPKDPSFNKPSPHCSWTNAGDRTCEYPPQIEPQRT